MFTTDSYTIATALFPRLLGFIYFFAFGAFLFQIKGLLGTHGIMPVSKFLAWISQNLSKRKFVVVPTLFWVNCSDAALLSVVFGGVCLSVLLMLGIYPSLMLLLLYVLYLSIISAGQEFLAFGWEGFLLEITVNAFLLSLVSPPNLLVWISLNFVVFRFHFQGGWVKLQSQDPNWRNLTGVAYHYLTQPIPNTLAWYAHKLPMWFQKFSTLLMLVIEIVVPFAMLGSDAMRLWVFYAFVGLQIAIWLTGNFSFLNHLTVVVSVVLVANVYMPSWLDVAPTTISTPPLLLEVFCSLAAFVLICLQSMQLWQQFSPNRLFGSCLDKIGSFHIVNRYGIFAIMTTKRFEIVFEGSDDEVNWKEYLFYYKPSEVTRRPRRISPYQPRIDWQAWFLPLGNYRHDSWFGNFIFHLLKGTPEVLSLIRHNPFPNAPPRFVRTLIYDYTFSSFEEKKKLGCWWHREYLGLFTQPVSLKPTIRPLAD